MKRKILLLPLILLSSINLTACSDKVETVRITAIFRNTKMDENRNNYLVNSDYFFYITFAFEKGYVITKNTILEIQNTMFNSTPSDLYVLISPDHYVSGYFMIGGPYYIVDESKLDSLDNIPYSNIKEVKEGDVINKDITAYYSITGGGK